MRCPCPGCTRTSGDRGYAPLGHGSLADAFLHAFELERGGLAVPGPGSPLQVAQRSLDSADGYRVHVLRIPSYDSPVVVRVPGDMRVAMVMSNGSEAEA